jgi:hypothetical protein
MNLPRASGVIFAAALLLFSASGCVTQTAQDTNASIDEDAVGQVSQALGDCNTSCGYTLCEPSYTPCVDGTCQALGNCCTVENQESDCAYMTCNYVPVCCPAN